MLMPVKWAQGEYEKVRKVALRRSFNLTFMKTMKRFYTLLPKY